MVPNELVSVFPGRFREMDGTILRKSVRKKTTSLKRAIVLDLDETLGSFNDLHTIWSGIITICPALNSRNNFYVLFDMFPEFLRPDILILLHYIREQKRIHQTYLYLYTNNKCSSEWANAITEYLSAQINEPVSIFDKIICAFKVQGIQIEPNRTTYKKTHADLIRCTLLPKTTEFCFVDDCVHDDMIHNHVYYICPRAYIHHLSQ